ncbi:MAG TPA: DUF3307 domain-containing protein [Mobilitalea sp.]|nr:DUF3307 domain-containing protein [Mobilitalea sp.]
MAVEFILICMSAHLLGDYYLQSDKMAEGKKKQWKKLFWHGVVYGIPFITIMALVQMSATLMLCLGLLILSHLLVDVLKAAYSRLMGRIGQGQLIGKKGFIYAMDQLLHLLVILILCYIFRGSDIRLYRWVENIFDILPFSSEEMLRWILLILAIYKPVNITIHQLFSDFKPAAEKQVEKNSSSKLTAASLRRKEVHGEDADCYIEDESYRVLKDKKAGAIIGFLERLLVIIFISIQQYAAIGLILTAKSIVRYDRITKDKEFSEYYLIGTLFSLIAALLLYFAVFMKL